MRMRDQKPGWAATVTCIANDVYLAMIGLVVNAFSPPRKVPERCGATEILGIPTSLFKNVGDFTFGPFRRLVDVHTGSWEARYS